MRKNVLDIVGKEYDKALEKHPEFGNFYTDGVSIIAEELGELAKEINEGSFECVPGWRDRAITEAAHVAVTAIRMMQKLVEDGEREDFINDREKSVRGVMVEAPPTASSIRRRLKNAERRLMELKQNRPDAGMSERGCRKYMERLFAQQEKVDELKRELMIATGSDCPKPPRRRAKRRD